jgi:glycerophosphoryl diester phosphodiesterase
MNTVFRNNGVTGHRGNPEKAPENTMEGFRSAIADGVDFLETDIHMTKDGKLVLCHDPNTKRTCGTDLTIAESTLAELKQLDASYGYKQSHETTYGCTRIPELCELLEEVKKHSDLRLSLQPKCDHVREICDEVIKYGMENQIAFNDGTLRYMIEAKTRIPQAVIFYDTYGAEQLENGIAEAVKHGFFSIVSHYLALTPERVKMIQAAGLEAGVWTVDDEEEIQRFLDMGVTRFYSDRISNVFRLKGIR